MTALLSIHSTIYELNDRCHRRQGKPLVEDSMLSAYQSLHGGGSLPDEPTTSSSAPRPTVTSRELAALVDPKPQIEEPLSQPVLDQGAYQTHRSHRWLHFLRQLPWLMNLSLRINNKDVLAI